MRSALAAFHGAGEQLAACPPIRLRVPGWAGASAEQYVESGSSVEPRLRSARNELRSAGKVLTAWLTRMLANQRDADRLDTKATKLRKELGEAETAVEVAQQRANTTCGAQHAAALTTLRNVTGHYESLRRQLNTTILDAHRLQARHLREAQATASALQGEHPGEDGETWSPGAVDGIAMTTADASSWSTYLSTLALANPENLNSVSPVPKGGNTVGHALADLLTTDAAATPGAQSWLHLDPTSKLAKPGDSPLIPDDATSAAATDPTEQNSVGKAISEAGSTEHKSVGKSISEAGAAERSLFGTEPEPKSAPAKPASSTVHHAAPKPAPAVSHSTPSHSTPTHSTPSHSGSSHGSPSHSSTTNHSTPSHSSTAGHGAPAHNTPSHDSTPHVEDHQSVAREVNEVRAQAVTPPADRPVLQAPAHAPAPLAAGPAVDAGQQPASNPVPANGPTGGPTGTPLPAAPAGPPAPAAAIAATPPPPADTTKAPVDRGVDHHSGADRSTPKPSARPLAPGAETAVGNQPAHGPQSGAQAPSRTTRPRRSAAACRRHRRTSRSWPPRWTRTAPNRPCCWGCSCPPRRTGTAPRKSPCARPGCSKSRSRSWNSSRSSSSPGSPGPRWSVSTCPVRPANRAPDLHGCGLSWCSRAAGSSSC